MDPLQALLSAMPGVVKAYFESPPNITMEYPAIRYNLDNMDVKFADNIPYSRRKRYQVTLIARKPMSETIDKLADLPLCSFNRAYVADNLHHTVFTLYF